MLELVRLATRFSEGLLGWFAETLLVASAFAGLAWLATRIRWLAPGPAARHAIWLLVLIKMVTPPLVHWPWSQPSPLATSALEASMIDDPAGFDDPEVVATVRIADEEATANLILAPSIETQARPIVWPSWSELTVWFVAAWGVGSIARAGFQASSLARFHRSLANREPAPAWLSDEADRVGRKLGVRVPPIAVVDGLATPMVWCLGRPILLVPAELLKTLEADRWRTIVAHELAHLLRRDHWVRRLELVAGLAWWWCPVYGWVCRQIEFEAELASDAWAVWESPANRLSYAESLIRISSEFSPVGSLTPALGVAGSGHSFERRLKMILSNQLERRVSNPSLLLAACLTALALPSWTFAGQSPENPPQVDSTPPKVEVIVVDDDGDEDDQKEKAVAKAARQKLMAEREALDKTRGAMEQKRKEMEQKRDAMARDLEAKFGPDSEFAKKMEAMGKEMEAQFGSDSEFAKKMEGLSKEMKEKFGPDSDFAKEMKVFVENKTPKFKMGQGKLDAKKIESIQSKIDASQPKRQRDEGEIQVRAQTAIAKEKKNRKIESIQSKIDALQQEIKKLKAEASESEEN